MYLASLCLTIVSSSILLLSNYVLRYPTLSPSTTKTCNRSHIPTQCAKSRTAENKSKNPNRSFSCNLTFLLKTWGLGSDFTRHMHRSASRFFKLEISLFLSFFCVKNCINHMNCAINAHKTSRTWISPYAFELLHLIQEGALFINSSTFIVRIERDE